MTRYTRAKGSKASNERFPNDGTPWYIMKQQLKDNLDVQKKPLSKAKSTKELLTDNNESPCDTQRNKINNNWAEFDENNIVQADLQLAQKKQQIHNLVTLSTTGVSNSNEKQSDAPRHNDKVNESNINIKNQVPQRLTKRQKRNIKKSNKHMEVHESYNTQQRTILHKLNREGSIQKKTLINFKDTKEYKRRKPDIGTTKIMINGTEIEIVKYDGFPVKKEDADRLKDLRQQMIMKGIPKTEINTAMKLERRKAEKSLARLRKCVCFHCRKSGHNLSDCPELSNEQSGTGICFKCGSTEHTHFECKVTKHAEYRYAVCFICREQGHIAKQCPDNPKGVYPQGGACKVCGDVTHLKKDCPDLLKEKEINTITAEKINETTLECIDVIIDNQDKDNNVKHKIIKF